MATINQQNNPHPAIVILGGGYAGMISALRLARNSKAQIHLVNPSERFVERIRLHEVASGKELHRFTIPALLRGKGVIFHQACATQIDWRNRTVSLSDGSQLAYDRLVYALGSQIDRSVAGASEHALALAGLNAAEQIPARLDALPAQSEVIVVGGGLTGTELVFELAERYPALHWTMVAQEAYDQGYAPAARQYFLDGLARRGITLRTGIEVKQVEADHLVTSQGDMPFALCLWAASFRGLPLGHESGLAVNDRDQLLADETLRSITAPEIYVAGDSAALPSAYEPYLVMGCKTAMPEGVHVAENLLSEMRGQAPEPLHFSYSATCVSLGRHDGLVQMLKPNGAASERFITGWTAAMVKELICRFTVQVLQLERHFNIYDKLLPTRARQKPIAKPQVVPSQGL
jgi:NADH dehydrogenase FAD-containing subunit